MIFAVDVSHVVPHIPFSALPASEGDLLRKVVIAGTGQGNDFFHHVERKRKARGTSFLRGFQRVSLWQDASGSAAV